MMVIFKIVESM